MIHGLKMMIVVTCYCVTDFGAAILFSVFQFNVTKMRLESKKKLAWSGPMSVFICIHVT